MKTALVTFLAIICLLPESQAQSSESHDTEAYRIKAGYFAESIIHPGIYAGIEKNIWSKLDQRYNDKRINPKRRKKVVLKEFYWSTSFTGYNHPNNEFMLAGSAGLGYQKSTSRGSLWAAEFGLGVARHFYTIPTYELEITPQSTSYRKVPLAGRFSVMPSLFLAYGWNAWLRKNRSWSWRIGPLVYARMPYNHTIGLSGGIIAEVIIHNIYFK